MTAARPLAVLALLTVAATGTSHRSRVPTGRRAAPTPAAHSRPRSPSLLPLVEIGPASGHARTMAVVITGDGGWASLERHLAKSLAHQGIAVVGLNSLHYFWHRRTPDQAAAALQKILLRYLPRWHSTAVILIGYSRGADVLPFMASRLPADLRSRVSLLALIGPVSDVSFQFHVTDWLWDTKRPGSLPARPELEKLGGTKILCIYGTKEKRSLCRHLSDGRATVVALSGGHRFSGHYDRIVRALLAAAGH